MDFKNLMNITSDPKIKEALKEATTEAVKRGVFGAHDVFLKEKCIGGKIEFYD